MSRAGTATAAAAALAYLGACVTALVIGAGVGALIQSYGLFRNRRRQ